MPEMVAVEMTQMAVVMIGSRMMAIRKAKSRTGGRGHLVVAAVATMMVVVTTLMSRSSGQLGPKIAL